MARRRRISAGVAITFAIASPSSSSVAASSFNKNAVSCFTANLQNDLSLVNGSRNNLSIPSLNILQYKQHHRDGEEPLPLQLLDSPSSLLLENKMKQIELTSMQERTMPEEQNPQVGKRLRTREMRLRRFLKNKAAQKDFDEEGSFISAFVKNKVNRKRRRERRRKRQSVESSIDSPLELESSITIHRDVDLDVDTESRPLLSSLAPEDLHKWACATDVDTLRDMFGTNRNKLWGDFDNETSRRLYHTLLPRALIGLYRQGLQPDELAPLAFEARKAAKEYARERCNVPGRLLAMAYDGFRHLKTYGSWSSNGLTWEEIWSKYEVQVRDEIIELWGDGQGPSPSAIANADLSSKVCLKILERSCITNEQIDHLVLKQNSEGNERHRKTKGFSINAKKGVSTCTERELGKITSAFEKEIEDLTRRDHQVDSKDITMTSNVFFALKLLVSTKRKLLWFENWLHENDNNSDILLLPEGISQKLPSPKKKIWECQDDECTL